MGFYSIVLEMFKHGIQRSGEVIFLGLLQLPVCLESEVFEERSLLVILVDLDDIETRVVSADHSNLSSQQSQRQCASQRHVESTGEKDEWLCHCSLHGLFLFSIRPEDPYVPLC